MDIFIKGGTFTFEEWFFFFFVCIWWQSCWHDLIEKVVPKCSRNTALLFISSSVTHCASCRLRWSYCEFINCPPRPWHVPQDNYEAASHGFILYSPISCMKTKLSCPMWLVTLRKKSFFHFIFLGSISLLYLLSFFLHKNKEKELWLLCCPVWICERFTDAPRSDSLDAIWPGIPKKFDFDASSLK